MNETRDLKELIYFYVACVLRLSMIFIMYNIFHHHNSNYCQSNIHINVVHLHMYTLYSINTYICVNFLRVQTICVNSSKSHYTDGRLEKKKDFGH